MLLRMDFVGWIMEAWIKISLWQLWSWKWKYCFKTGLPCLANLPGEVNEEEQRLLFTLHLNSLDIFTDDVFNDWCLNPFENDDDLALPDSNQQRTFRGLFQCWTFLSPNLVCFGLNWVLNDAYLTHLYASPRVGSQFYVIELHKMPK